MQAAGINMLRIMGATEGPDTEPLDTKVEHLEKYAEQIIHKL